MLNIALAQLNLTVGATDDNAKKILQAYETAAKQGADIMVCPELAISGYPPEDLLLRHDFIELSDNTAQALAKHFTEIDVILTYPCLRNGKRYNTAGWVRNGKIIAEYFKHSLPNEGLLDEKRYFCEGKDSVVVEHKGVKLGLLICEDLWHDENIIQAKNAGAQCILSTNASPFRFDKQDVRINILRHNAKISQLPIYYVNYVGSQDEFLFDGQSMAVSEKGELCYQAPAFKEEIIFLKHSHDGVEHKPYQKPDPLDLIYQGLVTGTRDYINKNGFPGAIIGLSGGIDSALTLAIAVDALGAERVHAVLMPSQYTADISNEDAIKQVDSLGVTHSVLPIKPCFDAFLSALAEPFENYKPDITEENIQARIRGTLLMALSNKTGKLVLTTGNKSEMAVGYATLYGDMAGGFAVLKDVYKTVVYKLARHVNRDKEIIPERVITREPSAELAPNQKDQDSLPPYEILDVIIKAFVEDDLSCEAIIKQGYDAEIVKKVLRLIQINEYKRRQAAPGIRITKRAFGRNRRYPITSGFIRLFSDQ
ncbi:MAG: NAD+ synthase [Gammaproteobacteria bacterium CG11_big_fil_rev_8_21_14_0_20_46_22]|nr:MAG: NAD+ synthase [Gammaproteobacteria bacterium CG12_big_fil_rev_8_21_14_0_65_46_12]PIR10527.1 MAG: NAD+ synthase [Gammaproteobacteria bacterium CG11_big_fil_rev_8_21_14_0_20_46_22]